MWLDHLAKEMKDTLSELLEECLQIGRKGGGAGVNPSKFPSQVHTTIKKAITTDKSSLYSESNIPTGHMCN